MQSKLIFGERVLSSEQITCEADRVRSGLLALGCEAGDRVAACLHNGPAYVILMDACQRSGLVLVPINRHFEHAAINDVLSDTRARALFIHEDLAAQFPGSIPNDLTVMVVPVDECAESGSQSAARWAAFGSETHSSPEPVGMPLASIFYTTGSTEKPKGVLHPTRGTPKLDGQVQIQHELSASIDGLETTSVAILCAPLYQSDAMRYAQSVLAARATLVLQQSFDARATLRLIRRHRITHVFMPSSSVKDLVALHTSVRQSFRQSSVKRITITGAPCPDNVKRAMIAWFGPIVTEAYSTTETGYLTSISSEDWLARPGSVGRPVRGIEVCVLDDRGRALPPLEQGALYARHAGSLAFEYLDRVRQAPTRESEDMVDLGDVGFYDESGFIYVLGRRNDVISMDLSQIHPTEVECALETLSGVDACAVFSVSGPEGRDTLAAAIQTNPGSSLNSAVVQRFLGLRLARCKVPELITFHDDLPREETGKVMKRRLLSQLAYKDGFASGLSRPNPAEVQ